MRPLFFDFVVGREHPGRRLGGAHAWRAVVRHDDRGAAAGQLVTNRATDDAAAKNHDIARGCHGQILAGGGGRALPPVSSATAVDADESLRIRLRRLFSAKPGIPDRQL